MLTPQRRWTLTGLALASLLVGLAVVVLLVTEGHAVAVGGHSTITELARLLWAHQPWVIWIVTHLIAAPIWFLMGHFVAAPESEYDRIRREGL